MNPALHRATAAYGVLALGIALSAATAMWTASLVEREARQKFEGAVTDARDAIQTRIQDYSDVLYGLKGLFSASSSISRDQFHRYIASLDLPRRYPGIQVIHYSHRVSAAQLNAFEAAVRNDTGLAPAGFPDFAVKPPGKRPEYVIVQYVEPMAGNEAALGLDLGGDAVRRATLDRARDSGQLAATGSVALALDPSRYPGFAVRLPIYRDGMPMASVAQRREAFTGMVSASFVVIDLMRGVLSESFLQNIHTRIHDAEYPDATASSPPPSTASLMFDSDRLLRAHDSSSSSPALRDGKPAGMTNELNLDVGDRRWQVTFSARQSFVPAIDRWQPWLVLLVGSAISLLLFALIRSLATTRTRAMALAASITNDMRLSEARLAEAQRMAQELIEVLPNPIFYKDTDGHYLGVNRAWEKFFGVARTSFVGKTVYDLYPDNRELADRLHALDQELFKNTGTQEFEASPTTPEGQHRDAIYYKATYARADGSIAGLIGTIVDITERKQAEAVRAQLAAIVENSNDAIISRALDGTILSWNAGAERMLGYTAAEVIGKPFALTLPLNRSPNLAQNNAAMLRGEVVVRESDRLTKDGRVINVLSSLSPIRDLAGNIAGATIILQDITALKQAQAAAKESEARFRITFEQAEIGMALVALDRHFMTVNSKFAEMMGYLQHELQGMSAHDIGYPEDHATADAQREDMLRGKIDSVTAERRFVRKDGSVFWARRTLSLLRDEQGDPLYFLSVAEDTTERKQAEAARASLETQLRESQKMQAMGTLAGGIAHDFNNIVAIILGNVELARQDARNVPEALVSLEQIKTAATRARNLVQQILAFSRRQPTTRTLINVPPVVELTANLLRATLPARLSLEAHCEPDVPPLLADATQIQQALINLATNAMQAIPSGSGYIRIRLDTVMLDAVMVQLHPARPTRGTYHSDCG